MEGGGLATEKNTDRTPSVPELPTNDRVTINDDRLLTNDDRLTKSDDRLALTTNDDRLTTNDDRLTTNDDRLTRYGRKASIYRQAIELPTISANLGGCDTPHPLLRQAPGGGGKIFVHDRINISSKI